MNQYDAAKILGLTGEIDPQMAKAAYRAAALKYHPDINAAGEEMMKLINEAFEVLENFTGDVKEQDVSYGAAVNDALNAIIRLAGLDIEICGAWIWVTGDTRTHKEALKSAGYRWASKKLSWYFRPAQYRSRSRGKYTMDDIRTTYGSARPAAQSQPSIH
ncbi:MAG: DnaJ domain-containing protein [Rhodospirillales bacterium]|nr:DnaJ domain-containing protein [Rhodospirillales bacterium]